MHSEIEIEPAGLRKRIIEDVLCVVIMAGVAAIVILGTPSYKTAGIPHGNTSASVADHDLTERAPLATKAATEVRSAQ